MESCAPPTALQGRVARPRSVARSSNREASTGFDWVAVNGLAGSQVGARCSAYRARAEVRGQSRRRGWRVDPDKIGSRPWRLERDGPAQRCSAFKSDITMVSSTTRAISPEEPASTSLTRWPGISLSRCWPVHRSPLSTGGSNALIGRLRTPVGCLTTWWCGSRAETDRARWRCRSRAPGKSPEGGFPDEFVKAAWALWLHSGSDAFLEDRDLLGLATGELAASVKQAWDRLLTEALRAGPRGAGARGDS